MRAWIDGVLRHSQTSLDTFAGGIDELHVGITWVGDSQAPGLVYVDEVIADDTGPIGCRQRTSPRNTLPTAAS